MNFNVTMSWGREQGSDEKPRRVHGQVLSSGSGVPAEVGVDHRDTKYTAAFDTVFAACEIEVAATAPRMNAIADWSVRTARAGPSALTRYSSPVSAGVVIPDLGHFPVLMILAVAGLRGCGR